MSGSSVSIVATRVSPKPRPARIGSARAIVPVESGHVMPWPGAQKEAHRHRSVGKHGGDGLEADLGDLVDGERKDIGGEPVTVPRQRIDQWPAVRLIMQEYDRALPAGFAVRRQKRAQLAHQRFSRWQGIRGSARGTDRGTLAAARADQGIDGHMIAGRRDGACRAKVQAAVAADDARARVRARSSSKVM